MSNYIRVLPRDLFNEASLLKCYGQLWLALEGNDRARFEEEDVDYFNIVQDEASGDLTIRNLTFRINGVRHYLSRPLNSRDRWPLYVASFTDLDDPIKVFDDEGKLSEEMLQLLNPQSTNRR